MLGLQVQAEIDRVLAEREQPDVAGYMELKYVMRCVNESMRLYPHPPVLLRRAELADTLPGAFVGVTSVESDVAAISCYDASVESRETWSKV